MQSDVHIVYTASVFEIFGYLLRDVDVAVGCVPFGIVDPPLAAESVNIHFYSVALFDVGVEEVGVIGRLNKFFIFSRPFRMFALLFFVPCEKLVSVVLLKRIFVLLGVDPLFVVEVFFCLIKSYSDVPWSGKPVVLVDLIPQRWLRFDIPP